MNPLSADGSVPDSFGQHVMSAPPPGTGYDSFSNRRKNPNGGNRAYPPLLLLSTGVAGLFCYLYLTKPVIVNAPPSPPTPITEALNAPVLAEAKPTPEPIPPPAPVAKPVEPPQSIAPIVHSPSSQRLPGDLTPSATAPRQALGKTSAGAFEETNLRIQHVLIAEAPGGARSRLEFEVPVVYRSRNLRWSPLEVTQARELLGKLASYQEKSRTLRAEGIVLLDSWNQLVTRSIPNGGLRADSPSLPANQDEAKSSSLPASFDTTEAIRIHSDGQ